MNNKKIYNKIFMSTFKLEESELAGLKYRSIPLWDSLGHMLLMESIEDAFNISIETPDMLAFSSYEKGMEILAEYGVTI